MKEKHFGDRAVELVSSAESFSLHFYLIGIKPTIKPTFRVTLSSEL